MYSDDCEAPETDKNGMELRRKYNFLKQSTREHDKFMFGLLAMCSKKLGVTIQSLIEEHDTELLSKGK